MSHIKQAIAFLRSRGYNKKIAKGMLDSLKQAGISDSALNGALMSLGGTGSVRFLVVVARSPNCNNFTNNNRPTARMDWYLLV